MNKRLSFIWILGASALIYTGCDGGNACDTAETTVMDLCGEASPGMWMCADGVADACNTCVQDHLADDAANCGTLRESCLTECCAPGDVCLPMEDAGMPEDDAGPDAGPPDTSCGAVGQIGGQCRGGTTCATGVTCFEELSTLGGGAPLTLGVFGIPAGEPDTANEGEYLSTGVDSTVPINFAPGGQCSRACNPSATDDGCGMCATCSTTLGGSDAWAAVGISVRSFDINDPPEITDANPGICRLNCQYDPATNGGCPTGYTCDPGENICVEACVEDSQCNVGWGVSRSDGLVAYELEGTPYSCNATTGLCEWTAPATAALNTECEENADCPFPGGICLLGGRCATLACSDSTGMMTGPVACDGACLGFGGNNGSICLDPCNSPDDCFPGQACSALSMALPTGETGICFAACANDAECQSQERCHEIREESEPGAMDSLSVCDPICDPDTTDGTEITGAITCGTDEICTQDGTNDFGYCEPINQICGGDEDCNGTQACKVIQDDLFGRCVDGCTGDTDCPTDEFCRIQTGETHGVCRPAGEECAQSPVSSGTVRQPLLGDAQCAPGQTCDAAACSMTSCPIGACTGTVTPSGCAGAGGASCGAMETCEAGGCQCGSGTPSSTGPACTGTHPACDGTDCGCTTGSCGAGFVCDTASGECRCDSDADCGGTAGTASCDTATGLCDCLGTGVTICTEGQVCTAANLCTDTGGTPPPS